jgi:peptidoglycan/xylan/chitin deacetylase (PgdA/CDA1 family)
MKYILRSIISTISYLFYFFKKREGVVVLMYHRVNDVLKPNDLVVSVERFRQHMRYLKRNCEVISMEQFLLGHQVTKSPVTSKTKVLITFDDGYRDNYLNAYPILKELGLPATIFLTTGMIGTDLKRPRYQTMPIPDMLNWGEVNEMAQNGITFGPHTVSHPHLAQLSREEQEREIGESIKVLRENLKIEDGRENIDKKSNPFSIVDLQSSIFCYPYGDYNETTLKVLKELGVKIAFTVRPGINEDRRGKIEEGGAKEDKTNPLELRRVGISEERRGKMEDGREKREGRRVKEKKIDSLELKRTGISGVDTIFDLKKKLAGSYDFLHWVMQKIS